MDDYVDETMLELDRFAIGQPVPRSEDPVLLRGEGHYADDVSLPGQAYAVMVRSHFAHGVIRRIGTEAARGMPGVLGVYTAADLAAAGIGPLPPRQVMNNRDGTPMLSPVRHALATEKVRHVGEAIAAVVADTVARAKDAAEAVAVEIQALPAVGVVLGDGRARLHRIDDDAVVAQLQPRYMRRGGEGVRDLVAVAKVKIEPDVSRHVIVKNRRAG